MRRVTPIESKIMEWGMHVRILIRLSNAVLKEKVKIKKAYKTRKLITGVLELHFTRYSS